MGCGPSDESAPVDTGSLPQPLGDLVAFREAVQPGPVAGFACGSGSTVVGSWEGTTWVWRTDEDATVLSLTETPVTAAAETSDGLWVVMGGALYLDTGTLLPVDWMADLDGTITRMRGVGDALWIWTDEGVYVRADDTLRAVMVDGAPTAEAVAPGAKFEDLTIFWAASGSTVFGMDDATGDVLTGAELEGAVGSLAVDGSGRAWAVAGDALWSELDGVWSTVPLEGWTPLNVLGRTSNSGVWVEAEQGWLALDAKGGARVSGDLPTGGVVDLDGWGRLVYADDAGLWRVAADRPIEVAGLEAGETVIQPTNISLRPSSSETLETLTAELRRGDEVRALQVVDDSVVVDPLGLVFGAWTVSVQATHSDGAQGQTDVPVVMAASGGATWGDHIQPLYLDHCATCHGGAADTVLETREDWIESIDLVLENVLSGAMPLVGGSLEDGQIAMIQAWQAGGFAE